MSKASSGEWQRARLKEVLEQNEHKQERLLNKNNRYGYEININHPYIQEQWQKFKQLWSAGKIETDKPLYDDAARRLKFEEIMKSNSWFQKKIETGKIRREKCLTRIITLVTYVTTVKKLSVA